MQVSIIIPHYNQENHLKQCLGELRNQLSSESIEIIVVDNGSSDNPKKLVEEFGFSYITYHDKQSPYAARNYGVKFSKSKYLAFLDSKCLPHANYIEQLLKVVESEDIKIGAGEFTIQGLSAKSSVPELGYAVAYLRVAPQFNGGNIQTHGGNLIILRSVFDILGQFREERSGSDTKMGDKARKLGIQIDYLPNLIVSYFPKSHTEVKEFIKRISFRKGLNISIWSVRPPSSNYLKNRLNHFGIHLNFSKKIKLIMYIWYMRWLRYFYSLPQ